MVLLMKRSLKGSNEKSTCVELLVELSKCKSEKHSIDLKLILIFSFFNRILSSDFHSYMSDVPAVSFCFI